MEMQSLVENSMKQKKRTQTIILCALLAILVIIAAFTGVYVYLNGGTSNNEYNHYIDLANQNVEDGNYNEAIKNYWIAIEKDSSEERVYLSLGSVYEVIDSPVSAIDVYNLGYKKTGSVTLANLANSLSMIVYGNNSTSSLKYGYENSSMLSLNTSFLNKIRLSSYSDFINNYGEGKVDNSNGKCSVSFNNGSIVLYYFNTTQYGEVIDASTKKPKSDCVPNEISVSTLSYIFSGMEDNISFEELKKYNIKNLNKIRDNDLKKDVITFNYEDCKIVIECDTEGKIGIFSWNRIYPNLSVIKLEEEKEKFTVEGSVINATTGEPVENATITVYKENDFFTAIDEYVTGSNGEYTFDDLEEGNYSFSVHAEGFTEDRFDKSVASWENNTGFNMPLSPKLNMGEVRIVLTWNDAPRDLDSYLDGVSSSGAEVHINFMNKTHKTTSGYTTAELDLDDRDGNGPETTTIYDVGGTYTYTVKDFTRSGTMAVMGATVRVYIGGESSPRVYEVPSNVVNAWEVFTIRNGEIEDLNNAVY